MNDKPLCKNCEYWRGNRIGDKRRCLSPLADGRTYVSIPDYTASLDGCSRYKTRIKKGELKHVRRYL